MAGDKSGRRNSSIISTCHTSGMSEAMMDKLGLEVPNLEEELRRGIREIINVSFLNTHNATITVKRKILI